MLNLPVHAAVVREELRGILFLVEIQDGLFMFENVADLVGAVAVLPDIQITRARRCCLLQVPLHLVHVLNLPVHAADVREELRGNLFIVDIQDGLSMFENVADLAGAVAVLPYIRITRARQF